MGGNLATHKPFEIQLGKQKKLPVFRSVLENFRFLCKFTSSDICCIIKNTFGYKKHLKGLPKKQILFHFNVLFTDSQVV